MKNLKKFSALALAFALMLSLLTGCSSGDKEKTNDEAKGDYSYHWKLATTESPITT